MSATDFLNNSIKSGDFTIEDDEDYNEEILEYPKYLAYAVWNRNDVRYRGEKVKVIEELDLGEDRGYGHDGQPLKVVIEVEGIPFVAIGQYDSWEGDHFPNGFVEAELVNVPTWLPKS